MFLRFLIARGYCAPGLEHSIPTVARWRLSSLPKYLPTQEVERLIDSCDQSSPLGALLGTISLHAVKGFLNEPELEAGVIAVDIMDEDFPRISRLQGIGEAFERFSTTQTEQLPVVDDLGSQRLIGSISKTDVILHIASKEGSLRQTEKNTR